MAANPILTEIHSLSPEAKAALGMAGHTLPPVDPGMSEPQRLPAPGMLLPHDDAPPDVSSPMPSPGAMPRVASAPQLITGAKRGEAMLSDGTPEPQGTLTGDRAERTRLLGQGSGISQISDKVQNSRLGQAHPLVGKLLGGLAEGAARIGDAGLTVLAPELAARLPGTELNHERLLGEANHALTQDTTNDQREAQAASENATAGKTAAETPEVAPNAESTRNLQGATAANLASETAHRNDPDWKEVTGLIGPKGEPIEVNSKTGDYRFGNLQGATQLKQPKPDTPEQQFIDEHLRTHPGSTIADAERAYAETTHIQQPPQVLMMVPNAGGGQTAQLVRPGTEIAPGAQTAAGLNAVNTPTTQQRTAAGRAETVVAMAPEVLGRIDAMAAKMGPIQGRWNDYMQGKVGMDDPDFAALRSDLLMMSSAVALAHAQGRLPENLREEFDRAINAPKQTPANLKATINAMLPWLTQMQNQGKPNAGGAPQGAVENWVRDPKTGKLVKQ